MKQLKNITKRLEYLGVTLALWWKRNKLTLKGYKYNTLSLALLPYINIQYYPYKGHTSVGCLKLNINAGWLIFGASITNKHTAKEELKFNTPFNFIN